MRKIPILHYQASGAGTPVILLHGFLASAAYWEKTVTELRRHHTVYALDLLGFGKSPKPTLSRYDLDAQIRSIEATIEHLGLSRKFVLVGHSMGSLIALHYANRHQQQIKKLILTNMPVFSDRDEARRDIYGTKRLYRLALNPVLHHCTWLLFKLVLRLRIIPRRLFGGLHAKRHYLFQNTAGSRLRSMRNLILQARVESELHGLNIKTIIVSGLNDRQIYLHNLHRYSLADHIQNLFVDGGHHLPNTNPLLIAGFVHAR